MWFHLHTVCFALSNQITELRYVTYHYQDSGFRDSMLEVVSTIESNRRVSTQSFVNDVGICSQGYWNKNAPTDWNRGESALGLSSGRCRPAVYKCTDIRIIIHHESNSNQFSPT